MTFDSEELRALLDALCEEAITPEQLARLEQVVLGDPQAEAYYVQYMSLHADLARRFSVPAPGHRSPTRGFLAPPQPPERPTQVERPRPRFRGRRRLLLGGSLGLTGLAAGLLLGLALWQRPRVDSPPA